MKLVKNPEINILMQRVENEECIKKLEILAKNIIQSGTSEEQRLAIAERALNKANTLKYEAKFHIPAESIFEGVAKAFTIEGAVTLDKPVSGRSTKSIRARGYVGFHIKNVLRDMCCQNYQTLEKMGKVNLSSEYFVYKYCQHLVSKELISKLASLFQTHPQLKPIVLY